MKHILTAVIPAKLLVNPAKAIMQVQISFSLCGRHSESDVKHGHVHCNQLSVHSSERIDNAFTGMHTSWLQ